MTNKTTSAIDLVERLRRRVGEEECRFITSCQCDDEGSHDALVNPDGPEAADTITRLQAALKPFVRHYEFKWMDERPDDAECCIYSRVTYGQLREAVAALRSSVGGE